MRMYHLHNAHRQDEGQWGPYSLGRVVQRRMHHPAGVVIRRRATQEPHGVHRRSSGGSRCLQWDCHSSIMIGPGQCAGQTRTEMPLSRCARHRRSVCKNDLPPHNGTRGTYLLDLRVYHFFNVCRRAHFGPSNWTMAYEDTDTRKLGYVVIRGKP